MAHHLCYHGLSLREPAVELIRQLLLLIEVGADASRDDFDVRDVLRQYVHLFVVLLLHVLLNVALTFLVTFVVVFLMDVYFRLVFLFHSVYCTFKLKLYLMGMLN